MVKIRKRHIKYAWITLNERCNNECVWCYEQCNDHKYEELSIEEIEKALYLFKSIGVEGIILIGGEPTLYNNLISAIDLVLDRGFELGLITNGRLLYTFCGELLRRKPFSINISLQGWNERTYSNFTKSNIGFDEVKKSVKVLQDNNFSLDFTLVLSKKTIGKEKDIANYLSEMKIKKLYINSASPAISKKTINGEYVLDFSDLRKHILNIYHEFTTKNIKSQFSFSFPHCIFSDDEIKMFTVNGVFDSGCHLNNGAGIILNSNFTLSNCTHYSDFELTDRSKTKKLFENKEEFIKFWNCNDLEKIRKENFVFRSEECKKCLSWKKCGGGCSVRWLYQNPTKFKFRALTI